MEKQQGPQAMNEFEYQEMTLQLRKNKQQMIRMLEQCPRVGAYLNETHQDWDNFYTFYINFLRSEIGPRGECAKLIRSQLALIEQEVNQALKPFGQNAKTHIRDIYMKNKFFIPCPEYPQMLKIEEANEKFKSNLDRLRDQNSPMRKQIAEGLITKHGKEYDLEEEFRKLQANYEAKTSEAEKEIERLRGVLEQCKEYHQYMRVKQLMEPYFKTWIQADSNMGKQNLKTGQAFEEKVNAEVLPYLLAREQNAPNWPYSSKRFQIFTNVSWIPKNLGEIDIAFGYKDEQQDRYFIFTLIECKSRLFDIRQAYKQVSLDSQQSLNKGPTFQELKELKRLKQRKSSKQDHPVQEIEVKRDVIVNKKFLSTKYGPAQLVEDHHYYIVTTLPQNEFVLPIESKMKEGIEKYSKNKFIEDMESQPLYLQLHQIFSALPSPLQWLRKYEKQFNGDESNILVLR